MNTRLVDPRTIWAVLAMEAGLALPIMSLPTQGDRLLGLFGPLLLLALLPLGFVAVYEIRSLRDPSWRLLTGCGLALLTRAIVSNVPEPGLPGLMTWFARSTVPVVIGIGLWWRGGALGVAELTAADVRSEFGLLAICLLVALALVRPFLLPDPVLLGTSVAIFTVGGLLAAALSRQDAADAASPTSNRVLSIGTALLPAAAAVLLVSILRPALLATLWLLVARAIELALTPLGLLLAWLASLIPQGAPEPPPTPVVPTPQALPNPALLEAAQQRLDWIPTVIAITLLVAAGVAAVIVARLLLANWIGSPRRHEALPLPSDVTVERTGTPRGDAQDFLIWLLGWLKARVGRPRAGRSGDAAGAELRAADAWTAYQRLLEWAQHEGLARRPSETTGQLQTRLTHHTPAAADEFDLVTSTYESERYGAIHPPAERLRQLRDALTRLTQQ